MVNERLRAVIHLDNLYHNYQLLKSANSQKGIFAVVKADGYGHGSVEISRYLESKGCELFAVTVLKEALELRTSGIKGQILLFGKTNPLNAGYLVDNDLIQTVDSYEYGSRLNDFGKQVRVHLKIDTGMTRLGLMLHRLEDKENVLTEIKKIVKLDNLKVEGIYTHFVASDSDLDFTVYQQFLFEDLLVSLKKCGVDYGVSHLSNSSGVLTLDNQKHDYARCGIALYGYPPVKVEEKFLPVMELLAKVVAIKNIKAGESVSYGRTFIAEKEMKVATIGIGYADGYPRILSNNDYFYYQGNQLKILGRVCMGFTMVDVTGIEISEDDEVEVFGYNKPLTQMANKAYTITYELLTNMAKPRVTREYKK